MAEMTHEPLLDDGDTTDLTELVEAEELRTYPGRYLASTVALTLESLHTSALTELAGLQGHGCAAESQRSRCLGRVDAVVILWAEFGLPTEDLGNDPGQRSSGNESRDDESQDFHGSPLPTTALG